jgi:hypothetical protein
MTAGEPDYVRAVAERFVKLRGRGLMVSPADLEVAAGWEKAGVPLRVALRGVAAAFRSRPDIRSLAQCRPAVAAEVRRGRPT